MTIAQITNDLRRKISFMERHPSTNPKSIQKLAFYKTWLLMIDRIVCLKNSGSFEDAKASQKLLTDIEKEFSK